MRKMLKRTLAIVLTAVMLFGVVPFSAYAKENEQNVGAVNNAVSLNSTNSFGKLLAENFDTDIINKSADYFVSDVEIKGKSAIVELGAKNNCKLVVAVYDENTNQMLTSAIKDVDAETEEVSVDFDSNLPDYFVIKAFLLDEMNSALCSSYNNYHYTSKFERFNRKTTKDFPADRVVNLDEDNTNNFFVLDSSVKKITSSDSVNTLITIDDENNKYVIGNIDGTVRSLKKGDTFFIKKGEDIVIVKIDSMKIDGSTATFTSTSIDSEVALDFVKIESEATTDEFDIDKSKFGEGINYIGKGQGEVLQTNGSSEDLLTTDSNSHELKATHEFLVGKTEAGDPDKSGLYAKMSGSLSLAVSGKASFYQDNDEDFKEVSLSIEISIFASLEIKAVLSYKQPICDLGWAVVPGCYVGVEPTFVVSGSFKGTLVGTLSAGWGATYNSDRGDAWQDGMKKPTFKPEIKFKIDIFVGVDLNPYLKVISKHLLVFDLNSTAGFHIKGDYVVIEKTSDSKIHSCESCIDGEINFDITLSFSVTLGKGTIAETKLSTGDLLKNTAIHLAYFYYSEDYNEFGFKKCPHCYYKVGIGVRNEEDGSAIKNAYLTLDGGYSYNKDSNTFTKISGLTYTNENGDYTAYYPAGKYTIYADATNFDSASTTIKVKEPISKEIIKLKATKLHPVSFNVTDAMTGKALPGITVTAINGKAENDALSTRTSTTTDSSGNVTLYYAYDSLEKKAVFTDNNPTTDYSTVTKTISKDVIFDTHYDISMYECKTSKITFKVTDSESGEGIDLASITLMGTEGNPYKSFGITDLSILTVSGGKATIEVPNGGYDVSVSATGYKSYSTSLTVNGDRTVGYSLDKEEEEDSVFKGTEATGTIINFGSYPQSRVKDTVLINKLDAVTKNWKSYNYYTGTGSIADGQMKPSDYMLYADFKYNGDKYRAVTFSQYRPYYTGYISSASNTYQDDNGYYTGDVYYFKYEPLKWRVLDAGKGLVMSANVIDSQAFNNYKLSYSGECYGDSSKSYYASDYGKSSIRDWLNNDFCNTAFSTTQQGRITPQTIEAKSTYKSQYDGTTTTGNKVFLLSYEDVLNTSYGFSSSTSTYDPARQLKSTDYAQSQGCYTSTSSSYYGNSPRWRLRSPNYSGSAAYVYSVGYAYGSSDVSNTGSGVIPALYLKKSTIQKSPVLSEQLEEKIEIQAESTKTAVTFSTCKANTDYILLNVLNYGKNFTLSADNLLYIDQLTADEKGEIKTDMFPKYNSANATTLVIGDFGKGVEVKIYNPNAKVKSVKLDNITVQYKNSATLTPKIEIDDGVKIAKTEYSSSNEKVAKIDGNGKITTLKKGDTTITCKVTDNKGNTATATCKVTVKYIWWQWLIKILLFGWIWY